MLPATERGPVVRALPGRFSAFEWNGYSFTTPPGAAALSRSRAGLQSYRIDGVPGWGIQFHAEVTAGTLDSWLGSYSRDADARAAGVDPDRLAERNRRELTRWNELGRQLCRGFVETATAR